MGGSIEDFGYGRLGYLSAEDPEKVGVQRLTARRCARFQGSPLLLRDVSDLQQ